MKIKITYVGILNRKRAMTCGFKPEEIIVEEERSVLFPEEGKELLKNNEIYRDVYESQTGGNGDFDEGGER